MADRSLPGPVVSPHVRMLLSELKHQPMRKINALLLVFLLSSIAAHAQCSAVNSSVSASDTTYAQLYHPGFFLIDAGFANVCVWAVATFDGTIVHQATTSGAWEEQSFMLFDHSVPISDSMQVTLVITNDSSGITCTIIDTLVWEETEVLPGSFIGNWAILGSHGGLQTRLGEQASSSTISVHPSPAVDHVRITGAGGGCALSIVDVNGALVATHAYGRTTDRVDVSSLPPGVYFIRIADERDTFLGTHKFVKL